MKTRILISTALATALAFVATSLVGAGTAEAGSKVSISRSGAVKISMGKPGKRNMVRIKQSGGGNTVVATGGAASALSVAPEPAPLILVTPTIVSPSALGYGLSADDFEDSDVSDALSVIEMTKVKGKKKPKLKIISTNKVRVIVKN